MNTKPIILGVVVAIVILGLAFGYLQYRGRVADNGLQQPADKSLSMPEDSKSGEEMMIEQETGSSADSSSADSASLETDLNSLDADLNSINTSEFDPNGLQGL